MITYKVTWIFIGTDNHERPGEHITKSQRDAMRVAQAALIKGSQDVEIKLSKE